MVAQLFTVKVLNVDRGLPQPEATVYVILVVPAVNAVTNPVVGFTVATAGLVVPQVPPAVPLLAYVSVAPIHNGEAPVTVPVITFGLTVSEIYEFKGLLHPVFKV